LDVVIAAGLLLLASPVLLFAALWIRWSSPGPVFFRQLRMGRGVKLFRIYKLRTMAHGAPGLAYTLGDDPRITPFGKWLRRTKIDELPQLLNVLRGEMSLVGPRPVIPELVMEFNKAYSELLRVRPGLTDPASLKYREETEVLGRALDREQFFKSVVTPDKLRMSLAYMERATLWTDLQTMVMTAVICCVPKLSRLYGVVPNYYPLTAEAAQEPSPRIPRMPVTRTESLFVPEPAYSVSLVDDVSGAAAVPWFLLQVSGSRMQSTFLVPEQRGSRL